MQEVARRLPAASSAATDSADSYTSTTAAQPEAAPGFDTLHPSTTSPPDMRRLPGAVPVHRNDQAGDCRPLRRADQGRRATVRARMGAPGASTRLALVVALGESGDAVP